MSPSSELPSAEPTTAVEHRIAALLRTLAHTGRLVTERVPLPGTAITLEVTRPSDIDLLLDQSAVDPEQNLPYWAEIWPSGVALAADIARHPERLAGRRTLELGCGLGVTAAVAVATGARLTAIDYAEESLTFTRITTLRHTGREPDALRTINWRSRSLHHLAELEPFSVVLAADVLYERRDVDPLIEAVDTLLADDGMLWLADPERELADIFLDALQARSWQVHGDRWAGPWPDPKDAGVLVRTHLITRSR